MAFEISKKVIRTKLASSQHVQSIHLLKYLRNGAKTSCIATRDLNSPSGVLKLENLASKAEKVVGYQTSLVRCLLSDEISGVLVHSKKLVGSRHPLLKTARSFVYDEAESFEAVGLTVLLMSRCGEGLMTEGAPLGQHSVSGIQQKQRKLAEVAEMINTGYMVHLGIVNKSDFQSSDDIKIMNFGNKVTVLTGDYFLAKASVGLSELENTEVVDVMASVIGDIVEGETMKDCKTGNDTSMAEWEKVIFKSQASLFAKSCLAALKLYYLPQLHQDAGFTFGKNLVLLRQVHKDYEEINTDLKTIRLSNVVVIQNKHMLPSNVLENPLNTQIPVPESTRLKLQNSETAQKIKDLANTYGNNAFKSLECFPNSEAKTCLENLVEHLVGQNK